MQIDHSRPLIIGCGGGYDIFCGLPLYFKYLDQNPILVNYSFTHVNLLKLGTVTSSGRLFQIDASQISLPNKSTFTKEAMGGKEVPEQILSSMGITRDEFIDDYVNSACQNGKLYFPEYELSQSIQKPVWAFDGEDGGEGIYSGLKELITEFQIDTIMVVDGGTDSLMKGSEEQLGTPYEDILTLSVIWRLQHDFPNLQTRLYVLGYNIDAVHGISDESVNQNILELIRLGGFLGTNHLLNDPDSCQKYLDTFLECSPENSWINSLVCASIQGHSQPHSEIERLRGQSKLPVTPAMGLYWIFNLVSVVQLKEWDYKLLSKTKNDYDVSSLIRRDNCCILD